jgi:CRP/FNR family transcriptional regulator, cyclic AMP receptor protein
MAKGAPKEVLEKLRAVPLFSECNDKELQEIAGLGTELSVSAGRELMKQGEPAHEAFLLMSGTASVTRDGATIATFGPGDFFGEMALIGNRPRTATVTADTDATVWVFHSAEFKQMMNDVPGIAVKILWIMAERLLDAEDAATH